MSKIAIVVLTIVGDVVALIGVIGTAASSESGWWLATSFGNLIAIYAWIWALREAWWTRAWGWLIAIVLLEVWFGGIAWGLFGPGRLAVLAERKLQALRDSHVSPQSMGIPAPAWTPEVVKSYLQQEGFKVQDDTLYRALRRLHWLV